MFAILYRCYSVDRVFTHIKTLVKKTTCQHAKIGDKINYNGFTASKPYFSAAIGY